MGILKHPVLGTLEVPDELLKDENREQLETQLIELAAKTFPEEEWYKTFTQEFGRGASETARGVDQLVNGRAENAYEKEFIARVFAKQNPKSAFAGYLSGSLGDVPSYLFGGFARKGAGLIEETITRGASIGGASGALAPVYEEFGDSRAYNTALGTAFGAGLGGALGGVMRKYGVKNEAELEKMLADANPDKRAQIELDIKAATAQTVERRAKEQQERTAKFIKEQEAEDAAKIAREGRGGTSGASPAFAEGGLPTPIRGNADPRPFIEEPVAPTVRAEAEAPTAGGRQDVELEIADLQRTAQRADSLPDSETIKIQRTYLENQKKFLDAKYARQIQTGTRAVREAPEAGKAQRIADNNDRLRDIQRQRDEVDAELKRINEAETLRIQGQQAKARLSQIPETAVRADIPVSQTARPMQPIGEAPAMQINQPTPTGLPTPMPPVQPAARVQAPVQAPVTAPVQAPVAANVGATVTPTAQTASVIAPMFSNFQSMGAAKVNPLAMPTNAAQAARMSTTSKAAKALPDSGRTSGKGRNPMDEGLSDAERIRLNSIREETQDMQQLMSNDGYGLNQRMSWDTMIDEAEDLADAVLEEISAGNYRNAGEWLLERISPAPNEIRILSAREKIVAARIRAVAVNRMNDMMKAYRSQIRAGGKDTDTSIRIISELQLDKELMESMDEMANIINLADVDASSTGRALNALRVANQKYKETMNALANGRIIDELFFQAGKC